MDALNSVSSFVSATDVGAGKIKIVAAATDDSQLGYTGFTQGCWSIDFDVSFDDTTYAAIASVSSTVSVCIEECMVKTFAPATYSSTWTYTIFTDRADNSKKYMDLPVFQQTPACGYPQSYSATVEKLVDSTNLVGDLEFPAEAID
jgi:hypothetical protein